MKRIQPAESSRQENSIESPSISAISEEEETYVKLTSNPQDCKESLFQNYLFFWNTQTDHFMFDFTKYMQLSSQP